MTEKKHNFKTGDIIIANDNLHNAFIYDSVSTELHPDVEYRKATSAEEIYFKKNAINSKQEIKTFESYKNENTKHGIAAETEIKKGRERRDF